MATIEETLLQDAAANAGTAYTMSVGDMFEGTFNSGADEDWIRMDLVQGEMYEINLAGSGTNAGANTILKIFNSAGEQIAYNDDIDLASGKIDSMVTFSPVVTGGYYICAGIHSGDQDNDNSGNYTVTVSGKQNEDNPDDADDNSPLLGGEDDDTLIGDAGNNNLNGGEGDDILQGGEGNDRLIGGAGADRLIGGPGEDYALYLYSDAGVVVRLHTVMTQGGQGGHAEGDTYVGMDIVEYMDADGNTVGVLVSDIEHLVGSDHNDVLAGDRRDNRLDGGGGDDKLYGGPDGGDDVLAGGGGSDKLYGGKGNDTLEGGLGHDQLSGGTDNDRLDGGGGNDELDGGAGNDWLIGGAGADILTGGAGEDFALYQHSDAGIVVRLHTVMAQGGQGGHAEGDTFVGMEIVEYMDADGKTLEALVPDIEHLVGSDHNDVLAGDRRDNRLDGGGGDDKLYGGPDGGDDVLAGGGGSDKLYGGKGNDTLEGGLGHDQLSGGTDNDRLDGGEGDDTFFFNPGGEDDTILDFGNGEDKIDLTAFPNIQSVADLVMQEQGDSVVIDLSAQGGGIVTLQDFNEADIIDAHFVFFMDDTMTMA